MTLHYEIRDVDKESMRGSVAPWSFHAILSQRFLTTDFKKRLKTLETLVRAYLREDGVDFSG